MLTIAICSKTCLSGIEPWLSITDLKKVLSTLSSFQNPNYKIEDNCIRKFEEFLCLGERQTYGAVSQDFSEEESEKEIDPITLFLCRDFKFEESLGKLHLAGRASSRVAEHVKQILMSAQSGCDKFPDRHESIKEVTGAIKYTISNKHELLIFRHENFICPLFVGTKKELTSWVYEHKGLTITASEEGAFNITTIGPDDTNPQSAISRTGRNQRVFDALPELDLHKYIPIKLIRDQVEALTVETDSENLNDIFDAITENSVRGLLVDLHNLIIREKVDEAKSRLSLFEGNSVPVTDVSTEYMSEKINGDQVNGVLDAGSITSGELKKLLNGKFQDWMLYPHPDQKKYIYTDYTEPKILNGISGSGKTCILVHRAKRLAEKYKGEKLV